MGDYNVYRNPNPSSAVDIPYLLVVQTQLLEPLGTRVVVPLYRASVVARGVPAGIAPVVNFQEEALVAMVPELAGVPYRILGSPVGQLRSYRSDLVRAFDLVVTGI